MTHHKRRRPKHQRAGCLMCKPHKDERAPKVARPKSTQVRLREKVDLAELEAEELDLLGLRNDGDDPLGQSS